MADALPIGYRFCPSEEELFSYCLGRRVRRETVFPEFIREFDVYEKEPWEFHGENAEKSLYVFTKLKKKKTRVERTAGSGYWNGVKTTYITNRHGDVLGHKKHFNFKVKGGSSSNSQNADKGSWIMHEYSMLNEEIVLCKIRFKKEKSGRKQDTTLVINMPIRIGENHRLNDSNNFNNETDVPRQDINVEPLKTTMCLGPQVKRQRLYCTGSEEDVLASASRPCLAISTQTLLGMKDSVGGRRPVEQAFMDNATSNGDANLLASTVMEEDTGDDDGCRWIHDTISFD